MRADRDFPLLTSENHRVTSPPAIEYNCIAWAAGDTENWWQPGAYWPVESPAPEYGIGALEEAFKALGFEPCDDDRPEPGFEKVALFALLGDPKHAARQLPSGFWTSKLGEWEDIEHSLHDLTGMVYGSVAMVMRRPCS